MRSFRRNIRAVFFPVFLTAVLLSCGCSFNRIVLQPRKVLDDHIRILMPTYFGVTERMLDSRYALREVYSDGYMKVQIELRMTRDQRFGTLLPRLTPEYIMDKMHPSEHYIARDTVMVSGKKIGYLEFMTCRGNTEYYKLVWYTKAEGEYLYGEFSCPGTDMATWRHYAHQIMKSTEVTKS